GRVALRRFSDRIDELLQQLFSSAPAPRRPAAVAAMGGYGRRQLCLHSDIDVLLLFDGSIGPDEERFVRGLLHPLWDLQVAVGHQIREVNDLAELEDDNPEFLLALLDARSVAGEASLVDRAKRTVETSAGRARILESLQRLIAARHAQFNDTLYQLEP